MVSGCDCFWDEDPLPMRGLVLTEVVTVPHVAPARKDGNAAEGALAVGDSDASAISGRRRRLVSTAIARTR